MVPSTDMARKFGMVKTSGTTETFENNILLLSHCILLTVSKDKKNTAPVHGAVGHSHGVELDHDQPPDSQHQGVPDGHRVEDHGEVDMEQQEDTPVIGKL